MSYANDVNSLDAFLCGTNEVRYINREALAVKNPIERMDQVIPEFRMHTRDQPHTD